MSKFDDLVDTARVLRGNSNGATWISKYQNPKVFKNVTEIKSDGNLKFVFTFGQAGLFSGLEEVVKPIIAIAGMFAPQMVKSGTNGVGGLYSGPLPTPPACPKVKTNFKLPSDFISVTFLNTLGF
jgi:hypothetical protein